MKGSMCHQNCPHGALRNLSKTLSGGTPEFLDDLNSVYGFFVLPSHALTSTVDPIDKGSKDGVRARPGVSASLFACGVRTSEYDVLSARFLL